MCLLCLLHYHNCFAYFIPICLCHDHVECLVIYLCFLHHAHFACNAMCLHCASCHYIAFFSSLFLPWSSCLLYASWFWCASCHFIAFIMIIMWVAYFMSRCSLCALHLPLLVLWLFASSSFLQGLSPSATHFTSSFFQIFTHLLQVAFSSFFKMFNFSL